MTQHQCQRAIFINNRVNDLQKVINEIEDPIRCRLWYAYKSSEWKLTPEWIMKYISDLLDKHDVMIRKEIEEEIKKLHEEIETL